MTGMLAHERFRSAVSVEPSAQDGIEGGLLPPPLLLFERSRSLGRELMCRQFWVLPFQILVHQNWKRGPQLYGRLWIQPMLSRLGQLDTLPAVY